MKLESKYKIGQTVYSIQYTRKNKKESCTFCDKKGYINYKRTRITCPKCNGQGYNFIYSQTKSYWKFHEKLTIGQVKITVQGRNSFVKNPKTVFKETQYMCWETGVGSGSIWQENRLFSSKKLALKEIEKRNQDKIEPYSIADREIIFIRK